MVKTISPCGNPNSHGEVPKRSPPLKVKVQSIKRKHLNLSLKTSGGTFKFQTFTPKYSYFSETFEPSCSTCISNLYVEHFNPDVEP